MQCHEVRPSGLPFVGSMNESTPIKAEKEAIHSGHFMVSHFEAEAQDDEYEVAVPVPDTRYSDENSSNTTELQVFNVNKPCQAKPPGQLAIETSLTKLFQCMSLAYRQKLTSPKWNRFKGIRLRWKDKIRLNNVIWRCWHMQFIKKENTLICQFASPLDEGTHNKPEAVVLEGKYWKRRLAAVTAEYKKWRMFYRNKIMDWACKESTVSDLDMFDWPTQSTEMQQLGPMMVDEDYMDLMSDTLFSTITSNQPFAFPDTREIARGANLADFIQPSLVQLQPNLDDFVDTFEPLQDLFTSKLPLVPEECAVTDVAYRSTQTFADLDVQNQASVVEQQPPPQEPETLAYRPPTEPSNVYQQIIDYTDSVPPTGPMKTPGFYEDKVKTEEMVCLPRVPGLTITAEDPNQYLNAEQNTRNKVINDTLSFEGDNSRQRSSLRNIQPQSSPPQHQQQQQQPFKYPTAAPKTSKFHQYHKITQTYPAPVYDGSHVSYDLSVAVESPLIKPSINPEQNMTGVKNRRRSREGVPKTPIRPSPLAAANSDSALNIPSALLAQLLTNNTTVHNIQNAADRFYATQPIKKSTRAPILPMPSKPSQQNKILLKPKKSAMHPTTLPSQNLRNVVRPVSSPDSPKDSSCVQNVPSPGTLSQSPTSPLMFPGSLSPSKVNKFDGGKSGSGNQNHRRVCHISAEQKRRYNIKNGFDVLHSLIPHLHQNPHVKLSKAAMLQKGAEYIRQLRAERLQAKEDLEGLRYQIESLSTSISNCQSLLPATGAPVSSHRTTKMKEMFDEFVRVRTMENWKFWIFSILFEPLLQSFSCSVSTASYDDLYRSTLIWVEQHCSLVDLRPAVLNSLRNLCTTTDILSDPSKLPEEARAAVNKKGI